MSGETNTNLFEEISEEEKDKMIIRRKCHNNRMIRYKGNILLPFAFSGLADHFHNFEFRESDVVVCTVPKSGTVWMAETIWAMINIDKLHTMDTTHINSRSFFLDFDFLYPAKTGDETPLTNRFRDISPEGKVENGIILQLAKADKNRRIFKTHLQFQFYNSSLLKNSKVVYVARNPKDVCVSLYHFYNNRPDMIIDGDFASFVESFMDGNMNFSPYWGHLEQAWKLRDHPNLHFVFYEDMKHDVKGELMKLNVFLGLDLNTDQLDKVLESTRFEKMRERDLKNPLTNMEGSFFRKGIIGDWKNIASPDVDAKMNCWIEENSKRIGLTFKFA